MLCNKDSNVIRILLIRIRSHSLHCLYIYFIIIYTIKAVTYSKNFILRNYGIYPHIAIIQTIKETIDVL